MKLDYFPLAFDSSMLSTWKSCPQLFNLIYLDDWKAKEENVHRHAGKCFAKGVEVTRTRFFVDKKPSDEAIAAGLEALIRAYGSFECPPDSAKSCERTAGAFEFYWDNYPLSMDDRPVQLPSGRLGIEISFSEPIPVTHPISGDPIILCGRMDAILPYANQPFIVDEKTTSSLGPTWSRQWDLRGQFTGYAWACRQAGIPVAGTIVRGVSILKTKYDTQQAIVYSPEWQINRWFEETCETIEEIVLAWKKQRFHHNLDKSCADFGGCAFKTYCSTQPEQANSFLETYFERSRWNPLVREEEK